MTQDELSPTSDHSFEEELGKLLDAAGRNGVDVEGAYVHKTDDGSTWEVLITAVDAGEE